MTGVPRSEAEIRERLALVNATIHHPPRGSKQALVPMLVAVADALEWVLDEHNKSTGWSVQRRFDETGKP